MLLGGVLGGVGGGVDQLQMDLQGRIAQKPAELGFRDDFGGHQVQQQNFQRPDILPAARFWGMTKIFSCCKTPAAGRSLGI